MHSSNKGNEAGANARAVRPRISWEHNADLNGATNFARKNGGGQKGGTQHRKSVILNWHRQGTLEIPPISLTLGKISASSQD